MSDEQITGELEQMHVAGDSGSAGSGTPVESDNANDSGAPVTAPMEDGERSSPEEFAESPVAAAATDVESVPAEAETESSAESAENAVYAEEFALTVETIDTERTRLKAIIEAVIYITDEPLSAQQIAGALNRPIDEIRSLLDELTADYAEPHRGLSIRELAGGYKLSTKPEHHEEIRTFVKNLKPPLKLSLAALETLAVIAYKQPITAPEIMEIRGVQGAGVLKTLLDRKLIATAGRKNVIGKPILYKTTREFLVQFGLKDLAELPTLKEFEELGRFALTDAENDAMPAPPAAPAQHEPGDTPVETMQDPGSAPAEGSGEVEPVEDIESITIEAVAVREEAVAAPMDHASQPEEVPQEQDAGEKSSDA